MDLAATGRLRLRPLQAGDLEAFVAYRSDPDVARDQPWEPAYGMADDRNTAVQRLLERLGFRCEARHVEADWFKGEWTTLRVYAILDREWR
jgi:RimJ/RimL family protein N-acetyltransferase